MKAGAYDVGAAVANGLGYLVDDSYLYTVDRLGHVTSAPLPAAVASAGIPDQHIYNNGAVVGDVACFYGGTGLCCYHTATQRWLPPATTGLVPHTGGAILALNGKVFLAGGYDAQSGSDVPTSTVDIVEVAPSSSY